MTTHAGRTHSGTTVDMLYRTLREALQRLEADSWVVAHDGRRLTGSSRPGVRRPRAEPMGHYRK